jgi:hypothetical protein
MSAQEPEFFTDQPRPEYTTVLSEADRAKGMQFLSNPLDFPTGFEGWIRDLIRQEIIASGSSSLLKYLGTTGELLAVYKDYTAETGLYTLEAKGGVYLYLNGASYSSGDYPDLYSYLGSTTLPDCRGRSIAFCGTHADVDLGDTFGPSTESSRRGLKHGHTHSENFSASGTFASSTHTHSVSPPAEAQAWDGPNATGRYYWYNGSATSGTPSATSSVSWSGSITAIGVDTNDAAAGVVVGSLFIRT